MNRIHDNKIIQKDGKNPYHAFSMEAMCLQVLESGQRELQGSGRLHAHVDTVGEEEGLQLWRDLPNGFHACGIDVIIHDPFQKVRREPPKCITQGRKNLMLTEKKAGEARFNN